VQPYRQAYQQPQPQPQQMARPESSAGRQVLIVLAVVLALLVLLCAGVISFLYKQGQQNEANRNSSGATNGHESVAVVHAGAFGVELSGASYRLTRQAGANPGWIPYNEGRQTL
jgi:serine/threonine-protein kinase